MCGICRKVQVVNVVLDLGEEVRRFNITYVCGSADRHVHADHVIADRIRALHNPAIDAISEVAVDNQVWRAERVILYWNLGKGASDKRCSGQK